MRATEFITEEAKLVKTKDLVLKYAFNDEALLMKAYERGTGSPLGFVKFVKEKKELYPENLWVHDEYRNRGIAKTMYDTLKAEGYIVNRSHDQTKAGTGFWDRHRGENAYVWEETIDEAPLPPDWDPSQMRQGATTFKSRLAYALERAKKLGTGSSRVATTIEYEGRPTVLKIAKNQKGLAQNSVEADILSDGYASQLGILIPIIDYDEQNREPTWIHTEMAQKASEKQLANMMGVDDLNDIVQMGNAIAGKSKILKHQDIVNYMRTRGKTEEQIETASEYGNILADLANSFDVELADFARKANWGLYNGKPVIVDVGFNSNVLNQYYREAEETQESGVSAGGGQHKWMGNEPYRHLVEKDVDEDMSRRGFLGALGGAAAAMTGLDAEAGTKKPKTKSPSQQTIQQVQKQQSVKQASPSKDPQAEAMLYKTAKASGMRGNELAQFLAQTKHESWNHSRLQEKPVGDPEKYFAKKYDPTLAPKTAKILGNKLRGDGAKYHGRGFIQLTGRDNYRMASEALGLDLLNRPDLASQPAVAAKIALWYWDTRVKPKVKNFEDTVAVTKTINNAMFGLEDRLANFIDYKKRIA